MSKITISFADEVSFDITIRAEGGGDYNENYEAAKEKMKTISQIARLEEVRPNFGTVKKDGHDSSASCIFQQEFRGKARKVAAFLEKIATLNFTT
jgi:hypothetical protein